MSTALGRYDAAAAAAANEVISAYSTSFALAGRLLRGNVRGDIRNLYAVVRIADEIVDGAAADAGLSSDEIAQALDDYEKAVLAAPQRAFHTDPVLHAFADTARRCRIQPDHLTAFFAAMRRDLVVTRYERAELNEYIYGSAEVIGLMCLSIFLEGAPATPRLIDGARRLGAAFQKVNFLRDIASDAESLGREYFPNLATDADKDQIVAEIRADLSAAGAVIPELPDNARVGVAVAADLFADLTERVDAVSLAELRQRRISVPPHRKAVIAAKAVARG